MSKDMDNLHGMAKALSKKTDSLLLLCEIVEDPGLTKKRYCQGTNERTRFEAMDVLEQLHLIEIDRTGARGYTKVTPTDLGRSIYIGLWDAVHGGRLKECLSHTRYFLPMFMIRRTYRFKIKRAPYERYVSIWADGWGKDGRVTKEGVEVELKMADPETVEICAIPEDKSTPLMMTAKLKDGFDLSDEETVRRLKELIEKEKERAAAETLEKYDAALDELSDPY